MLLPPFAPVTIAVLPVKSTFSVNRLHFDLKYNRSEIKSVKKPAPIVTAKCMTFQQATSLSHC